MADISDLMNMQGSGQPDPQSLMSMAAPLAAKGEELLKTGQVSLAQAKAAQKKLGLDPQTVNSAFQKAITGGMPAQAPPPTDSFNSVLLGQQPAQAPTGPPKVSGTKTQNTVVKNTDQKTARNSYADPEQAKGIMDTIRNTDEAKTQREGISKMEQMLAMNQAHQQPNDAWIKGLLAYGDSLNGTNQAASFEPQAAKRQEAMLKFANDIQQRKGDYAKSIEDALAKLKTGSDTNALNQRITDLQLATSGDGAGGRGSAYLKAIPIRAGQDYDKQLKDTTNSIEALNRGDSFLNDKKFPLTYQGLNQAQQDITKGLVGTGSPTDAKTAMDMQQVFEGAIQNLKTKYSGKFDPAKDDLRLKVPEIVEQVNKGLQKVRADMNDRVNRDADQIRETYASSFDTVPNLQATVEKKMAALQKRHPRSANYNSTGIFEVPGTKSAAPTWDTNKYKKGYSEGGHDYLGGDPKTPEAWSK